MREHNLHSNRQASSRDITVDFFVLEQLQFICEGGVDSSGRPYMCIRHVKCTYILQILIYHSVVTNFNTPHTGVEMDLNI